MLQRLMRVNDVHVGIQLANKTKPFKSGQRWLLAQAYLNLQLASHAELKFNFGT